MALPDIERNDGAIEQCIEELSDFLGGVQSYSPSVLAVALRVHLETLLQGPARGEKLHARRGARLRPRTRARCAAIR
jgi:hypothetical protein